MPDFYTDNYPATHGTYASGNNYIWGTWVSTTTANTTAATNDVWYRWSSSTTTTSLNVASVPWVDSYVAPVAPREPLDAELELQKAKQRILQRMWRRWINEARQFWADKERAEINARARELLLECLNPEQKQEYENSGFRHFHVYTANGRRKYRIEKGFAGNVKLVEVDGQPPVNNRRASLSSRELTYCIHPSHRFPDEDTMLAQKLLLETDEERFLQIANVS